jgi:hypothetical protein
LEVTVFGTKLREEKGLCTIGAEQDGMWLAGLWRRAQANQRKMLKIYPYSH